MSVLVHGQDNDWHQGGRQLRPEERWGIYSPGRGDRWFHLAGLSGDLVVELIEERGGTGVADALLAAGFVEEVIDRISLAA